MGHRIQKTIHIYHEQGSDICHAIYDKILVTRAQILYTGYIKVHITYKCRKSSAKTYPYCT